MRIKRLEDLIKKEKYVSFKNKILQQIVLLKFMHDIDICEIYYIRYFFFQCSKTGCGRKLHPTNRIHGANWCVGKQVFIIIECNSKRAICMLHVMDSENAGHNV